MTPLDVGKRPRHGIRSFFAIANDNTSVHLYQDPQGLLDLKDIDADSIGKFELFDVLGRRLAPTFDGSGALEGLYITGDRRDETMVHRRLCKVMKSLSDSIDRRLAEVVGPPRTHEQALACLPNLEGKTLRACFTLLERDFCDSGPHGGDGFRLNDNGSFWHNFWCH